MVAGGSHFVCCFEKGMLGIHSMYSVIGIATQSNVHSGLFPLFLYRNKCQSNASFKYTKCCCLQKLRKWSQMGSPHGSNEKILKTRDPNDKYELANLWALNLLTGSVRNLFPLNVLSNKHNHPVLKYSLSKNTLLQIANIHIETLVDQILTLESFF